MKRIYLDNAATTALDKEVLEAMLPFMENEFGNPSSTHAFGRKTKAAIEAARKTIAGYLNALPSEIIFTSGGTEADNMAIHAAVNDLGVQQLISSSLEHHAVLHTLEAIAAKKNLELHLVKIDAKGHIDLNHLETILNNGKLSLVTLMHANNEIGNLLPLEKVGALCEKYNAFFHTDTVQTMGHYKIDVKATKIHFLTCGAHKFHGPKGVGFLYRNEKLKIHAMIHGGAQERGYRGGTENLYGIVGMAKAFEIAYRDLEAHQKHVQSIKNYMIQELRKSFEGVTFNGDAEGESLYTVLNVSFPPHEKGDMLLFSLDLAGVAASGGSACSSGSNKGSHVLGALGVPENRHNIRFSFCKNTTKEEIDYALDKLKELLPKRELSQ